MGVQMAATPELTRNQALVFGALSRRAAPVSTCMLLDDLRDEGVKAPLQVYRALDKLLEFGLVHRLESINAFVACAHPHEHKHGLIAFAICKGCGQAEEFPDSVAEGRLRGCRRIRHSGFPGRSSRCAAPVGPALLPEVPSPSVLQLMLLLSQLSE